MSNKTNMSNKKNAVVIDWPTGHFTIDDIWTNIGGEATMPNITLRFRVKKALENKEIVNIGKIKPAIGRPKLVFARANPTKELLEAAKTAGVISNEALATLPIAEVKSDKKTKTVVPATAAVKEKVTTPITTVN